MILLCLLILAFAIQMGYALYFFSRIFALPAVAGLPVAKRRQVSIIICAKDEAENLKKTLPAILSQKYHDDAGKPMYEVLLINDASTDNTTQVLNEMRLQYNNLWEVVISQEEERLYPGKKFALSKGLEHASYHWFLLTDADCAPASDRWLELMVAPLGHGKEIVTGYGGYHKTRGVLNAFTGWETMHTFLQYSTYALAGKPYMSVGRNLACTKKAFQRAQRNEIWAASPTGDDDLLVSIAGNAENTTVVCDEAAFTYSDAKTTWKAWQKQKQRHLSTGKFYYDDIKLLLGLYAVSHADMWVCFTIMLFFSYWKTALIIMGVRCLIYWVVWAVTAAKLSEQRLIILFPFFDLGWLVYNFAFLPYIAWKNKQHWT